MPRRRPAKRRPNKGRRVQPTAARVRLSANGLGKNPWVQDVRPMYQAETLANAISKTVATVDKFIVPSIQGVMGPSPIISMTFDLFSEGSHRLVFRLSVTNAKRKRGTFGFVVTKRGGKDAEVAAKERTALKALSAKAPALVLQPFLGGTLYLPDRLRREGLGRELYAFVTKPFGGFTDLTVRKGGGLALDSSRPRALSQKKVEEVKRRIAILMCKTYDDENGRTIEIPRIEAGDIFVNESGRDSIRIKLTACRGIRNHMTPKKFIRHLTSATYTLNEKKYPLTPTNPHVLPDILATTFGKEKARAWLGEQGARATKRP